MQKKLMSALYSLSLRIDYYLARILGRNFWRVNKSSNYQPLPWIGLKNSRRTQGTIDRWKEMEPFIETNSSVLDIGCDVGYFVFKCAQKGCLAWGVDNNMFAIITADYAKNKTGLANAHFFLDEIGENNITKLPEFDYIIYLSVFHHWCRYFGFEKSKAMLGDLFKKTKKGLFFEMGQEEMDPKFNVPKIEGDFKQWMENFLKETSGRKVKCLGDFEVFVNRGSKKARRFMFLITSDDI